MNKSTKKFLVCFLLIFIISFSFLSIAKAEVKTDATGLIEPATKNYGLKDTAETAELTSAQGKTKSPQNIIIDFVGYLMAFTGIILLSNILLGGYQWMTSEGNEEKITKAKNKIIHSVIGMIIIMTAYVLVSLIFNRFFEIL